MKISYKFKGASGWHDTSFDTESVKVFQMKQRIMNERDLGKGTDFHLYVYAEEIDKELSDDSILQDRQHIIVRRIVALAPGKGSAYEYI